MNASPDFMQSLLGSLGSDSSDGLTQAALLPLLTGGIGPNTTQGQMLAALAMQQQRQGNGSQQQSGNGLSPLAMAAYLRAARPASPNMLGGTSRIGTPWQPWRPWQGVSPASVAATIPIPTPNPQFQSLRLNAGLGAPAGA